MVGMTVRSSGFQALLDSHADVKQPLTPSLRSVPSLAPPPGGAFPRPPPPRLSVVKRRVMRYLDQASSPLSPRQPPPPTPLNPREDEASAAISFLSSCHNSHQTAGTEITQPCAEEQKWRRRSSPALAAARKRSLRGRFTEVRQGWINLSLFFTLLTGH